MSKILNPSDKETILLFYKEYEADKFVKYDRYLKRLLKPIYHKFHHRQKKTGFAVSFDLMQRSLKAEGFDVRINDYATAKNNPGYPVGLIGFPLLLEKWALLNPAVLGPSLYDHPMLAPNLFEDKRFRKYVVLAPWTTDLYAPVYGDHCFNWFAGIDPNEWPDLSSSSKHFDFLIYDKVRWDHDKYQIELINPILKTLDEAGKSYRLIRYKMHDHETFRSLLSQSRALLFLCEHETQGIAYQEAMASGLPVLAWDRGYWADPLWKKFGTKAPKASSVPFFDNTCGRTFEDIESFPQSLLTFGEKIKEFAPREFVKKNLCPKISANIYAEKYFESAGEIPCQD